MLSTLIKGVFIGIIVSAPMGPVGMLCIRRTLTKGYYHGLVTGLGATVSDLLYAAITLLGVSAFIDFINDHSSQLQLFGSLFIIGFAIYLFFSNPIVRPHKKGKHKSFKEDYTGGMKPLWRSFYSAFLLTFSNLLIVILYIGLFAQFSFLTEVDNTPYALSVGLLGIAIGAIAWWFFITNLMTKLKQWFNIRSVKVLNRMIGSILFLAGVVGCIQAALQLI